MQVTSVSLRPTPQAEAAGRPALTPELLAASGARYSRNNEGLQAILDRINPDDLDHSVDTIFRMLDYGHQSIADMAPVAMFLDDISIWLAYYVWSLCPTAGGQESSTRYIELSDAHLTDADLAAPENAPAWRKTMQEMFDAYQTALHQWELIGEDNPQLTQIPESLLSSDDPKEQRKCARMLRNYRFDRARIFLPAAALTNVMLVMSARAWANLCQHLCSHPLPEANALGDSIREELALTAPRLLKHATSKPWFVSGLRDEFARSQHEAQQPTPHLIDDSTPTDAPADAYLRILAPESCLAEADLAHHPNRYAWIGPDLRRTAVTYGWKAITLAEIRDLNRHRTGTRYCPLVPRGFYGACDQLPDASSTAATALRDLADRGRHWTAQACARLAVGDPTYVYWLPIGAQFLFERTTTADKMIYEAELRTGLGAHYRYAKHYHDLLKIWYDTYPNTRATILEGEAEPE
jgi:thymidylate synthase ThyX